MIFYFKSLFFTDTGKDTSIVFAGTLVNVICGGLFFILAPRILGPSQYGLFSVIAATGVMVANLANFGIDTGILRFVKNSDQSLGDGILKLAFQAYILIGITVFILGFLVSGYLANLLGHPNLGPFFKIAFAGIILLLLTDFFVATLQAKKQFLKASIVNISSNLGRFIILVIAAYFFTINLYFLTILFFFITIISVIVGKLFVPFSFLKAKGHYKEFKNFFGYNFWIAASMAIASIPIDNYLLLKFAGTAATGLFAAPYKILSAIDQFAGNFSRVLAPRFTSFDSDQKAKDFAKKAIPIVLVICAGILISVLLAKPLVILLFGRQYLESVLIFQIVGLSYIFYFANTIPVSLIIYYFGKPKATFFITVIVITIWVVASIFLIPAYQAIGAAVAHLISGISSLLLFTFYALRKFSTKKNNG